MMLEELQRRNYSKSTTRYYLQAVANFARHFGKSPDKLGPDELRSYQAYLLRERKLAVGIVIARVAALRFFFIRTLKRHEFRVSVGCLCKARNSQKNKAMLARRFLQASSPSTGYCQT